MTTTTWTLQEASFSAAEATQMTGVMPGTWRHWRMRGFFPPKAGDPRKITLREVIWVAALSSCAKMFPARVTGLKLAPVVDYALLRLARETQPWPFVGPTGDEASFRRWSADETSTDAQLRGLLKISGDLHRYVAFHPKEDPVQFDDSAEMDAKNSGRAYLMIDGEALAQRVRRALIRSPFVAAVAA
jgi:hypothetical protein